MSRSRENQAKGQYDVAAAELGENEKELKDKEAEMVLHKNDIAFLNSQLDRARSRVDFLNERFVAENQKAIRCS